MLPSWQHDWLRLELATRLVLAERMTRGPNQERDSALMVLIRERRKLEQSPWFN